MSQPELWWPWVIGGGLIAWAVARGASAVAAQPPVGPVDSPPASVSFPKLERYAPGSADARALFRAAAIEGGFPATWADSEALHDILRRESDGWVGRPNYRYQSVYGSGFHRPTQRAQWPQVWADLKRGRIRAASSATGLGQMILENVERWYPDGKQGIADPLNEAIGMLAYIRHRYDDPDTAMRVHALPRCPDGTRSFYSREALRVGCKPGEGY